MKGKNFFLRNVLFLLCVFHMDCCAEEAVPLSGEGSYEEPYLIQSPEDLIWFRDAVNDGEGFAGKYFRQTENIDLADIEWEPIGIFDSGYYFEGFYDGMGHYIENLSINREDNCAFFGVLSGKVMNLGIESGSIMGACAASIAGHAYGDEAQVINCYNKADVRGTSRAGGIVDNFVGDVCNCVNMGQLESPVIGEISSYNVNKAIYCYGLSNDLYPLDFFSGWEYKCEAFMIDSPEIELMVKQLNRNVYWLKQDVFVNLGELQYWDYTDGQIRLVADGGGNDFRYAGKLLMVKVISLVCLGLSVSLILLEVVKGSKDKAGIERR